MASNTSGVMSIGQMMTQPRDNYVMQDGSATGPQKVRRAKVTKRAGQGDMIEGGVINVDGYLKPKQQEQARPIEIKQEKFDSGTALSTPVGEEFPVKKEGIDKTNQLIEDGQNRYKQAMTAVSGLQFVSEVLNANNAYRQIQGTAALNIMQSKNQEADVLYRGRQAALDAKSEGYNAGQDALLNAAAQGQDVNGAATQKIQNSYEAIGAFNAAQEEINAYREANGLELERVNFDYQVDSARINRDYAVLGSALNFGANAYAYRS